MHVTVIIFLAAFLTGCGFKGALYLPEAAIYQQKNALPSDPSQSPEQTPPHSNVHHIPVTLSSDIPVEGSELL